MILMPHLRTLATVTTVTALVSTSCGGEPPRSAEAEAPDSAPAVNAALPSGPDIWLATLSSEGGRLHLGTPRNLTRHPGYDNQPYFLPDGGLLFTRQDGEHTDIWKWDAATDALQPVTRTDPESEYSPTPLPAGPGFSAVRVEADSTQRLWRFAADGSDPTVLLLEIAPVGYHAWFDADHVALFVLGEPSTLQVASISAQSGDIVATDVGRSLQPVPGRHAVSFVQHTDGGTSIRLWDLDTGGAETVAPGLHSGDFHAWTPEGVLLQAQGGSLFRWDRESGLWEEVADLSELGITISRLAVSPDGRWLAFVAEPAAPPETAD